MISKEVVDLAVNKKYSSMAEMVKNELANKLAEHPVYKEHSAKVNHSQLLKSQFAKINGAGE